MILTFLTSPFVFNRNKGRFEYVKIGKLAFEF